MSRLTEDDYPKLYEAVQLISDDNNLNIFTDEEETLEEILDSYSDSQLTKIDKVLSDMSYPEFETFVIGDEAEARRMTGESNRKDLASRFLTELREAIN